jgi:hypothetical protein
MGGGESLPGILIRCSLYIYLAWGFWKVSLWWALFSLPKTEATISNNDLEQQKKGSMYKDEMIISDNFLEIVTTPFWLLRCCYPKYKGLG